MQFKTFALAALASTASAQSLTEVLANTTQLSNLTALISSFPNLLTTLGGATNITILAPNNAALTTFLNSTEGRAAANNSDLVQALLTYHVVNGSYANFTSMPEFLPTLLTSPLLANVTGGQRVEARSSGNTSTIISALQYNSTTVGSPVTFNGGVVHIINRVLTPPGSISETARAYNLTSAVGALTNASLVQTVNTTPDLTVFVPNNAAFQRIGSALSTLTTEQLGSILQYHVHQGTVAYSSLLSNMSISTLQGGNLTITVRNATNVYVNGARVVLPNVLVANGVVHVIDNVLNPMNATATVGPTESTGAPAYSGASSVTTEPYTSGVATPTSTINTASVIATATRASTSTSNAAWMAKPTGMGAAILGGAAALVLAL